MRPSDKLARWIVCLKSNPAAKLRLFCFPYAGGGSTIYRDWPEQLDDSIELCAVQPPGRENRIKEPPIDRLAELIKWLAPEFLRFTDLPFIFFGHSLGALVAFELMRRLRRDYAIYPRHLLVSAHIAPQCRRIHPPYHKLSDAELIERLASDNGTAPAILANSELIRLLLPRLRADFALCETYEYQHEPPFPVPITAFGGTDDTSVPVATLQEWRIHTTEDFKLQMLAGDHFFIHSAKPQLLGALDCVLHQYIHTTNSSSQQETLILPEAF